MHTCSGVRSLARRGFSRSASSTDCKYACVGLTCEKPRRASVSNASRHCLIKPRTLSLCSHISFVRMSSMTGHEPCPSVFSPSHGRLIQLLSFSYNLLWSGLERHPPTRTGRVHLVPFPAARLETLLLRAPFLPAQPPARRGCFSPRRGTSKAAG